MTDTAYARILAALAGRTRRTVATATVATVDAEGVARVTYRGTDVVTAYPDGTVTLDTGGWPTATTRRRMDDYLPDGVTVEGSTLRGGMLPRKPRPWTVVGYTGPEGYGRGTLAAFTDAGPGAYVVTDVNPWTGAYGWGSAADDRIRRETVTIPGDVLAASVVGLAAHRARVDAETARRRDGDTTSLTRPCPTCGAPAGVTCDTPYRDGHPLAGLSHGTRVLGCAPARVG